jgi:2-oxoglutarate dehydrogenase E2 component (dihydrolipoamide succinyltransferase)
VPTPSARRALREHGLAANEVEAAGKQLRREDVLRHVQRKKLPKRDGQSMPARESMPELEQTGKLERSAAAQGTATRPDEDLQEERVPMTMIRRRIAENLVAAQKQAALLTTYNEIDMTTVMTLRKEYGERFRERYGVKLGLMSFFVKAVVDALRDVPELNAEVRGTEIIYKYRYDIGIAIGSEHGLVVPVLRNAERLNFAEIERSIADFASRASSRKLLPQELSGGTFTISNGGIYGSLLSTPIVNPPQSGVLGMHAIQDRPVARDGQIVIRPMMYVALTYDHRIIDGREAVSWLRRVKEAIEQPARMLIEA